MLCCCIIGASALNDRILCSILWCTAMENHDLRKTHFETFVGRYIGICGIPEQTRCSDNDYAMAQKEKYIMCGITSFYYHSKIIFWFIAISCPQSHHRVHTFYTLLFSMYGCVEQFKFVKYIYSTTRRNRIFDNFLLIHLSHSTRLVTRSVGFESLRNVMC